jgi:diadenosine tetraphosphate (Ap4A) HIT family hydrolase
MSACGADHVNVECLGNQIPHLHWQVIPRYKTDPRWGGPTWTTTTEELHDLRLSEAERQSLMADIRAGLKL